MLKYEHERDMKFQKRHNFHIKYFNNFSSLEIDVKNKNIAKTQLRY